MKKAQRAKVEDLMVTDVVTVTPETTLEELRQILVDEGISAAPVMEGDELVGMVTATDLLRNPNPSTRVEEVMSDRLFTVPPYADLHLAARIMRNHGLHHVVVTLDQKLTGILASYDLLALVEQHRFTMTTKPSSGGRKGGRRRKLEKKLAKSRESTPPETPAGPPTEDDQREKLNALLGHLTRRDAKVEAHRGRRHGLEQDFAEQAVVRQNDEVLDALSKEGASQLAVVGRALERLDDGTYGTCEDCDGQVGAERLAALPYAVTCIACAQKRESS